MIFNRASFLLLILFSTILFTAASINKGFFSSKLTWDEVDYVKASQKGIVANAMDAGDPSFIQFIKLGIAKLQKDSASVSEISLNVTDEEEQLFMLRHFHPPFPIYYWSFFLNENKTVSDLSLRLSSLLFFVIFLICFLYLGSKQSPQKLRMSRLQALLAFSFFTSPIFIYSNSSLNFHIFHALACLFFVFNLQNYLSLPNKKNEWLLSLSIAGLILTLDTSVFVILIGVTITLFSNGLRYLLSLSMLRLSIKSFLIFIFFWPGSLITGGPIKSWFMHAYRIFAQGNEENSSVIILNNLQMLFYDNIILTIFLILTSLIIIVYSQKYQSKSSFFNIALITGFAYGAFLTPFALNFTYYIPAMTLIVFGLYLKLGKLNA
jgi:hypothetical protein